MTREQIRILTPKPAAAPSSQPLHAAASQPQSASQNQKSTISNGQPQYFLPTARALEDSVEAWRVETGNKRAQFGEKVEMIYRPVLLAQAVVRYISAKADLNADKHFAFLLPASRLEAAPHWNDSAIPPVEAAALRHTPQGTETFAPDVPLMLTDPKKLAALQKDLCAYLYRTAALSFFQNPSLKLYSRTDQTPDQFRALCGQTAEARRVEEVDKVRERYDKKIDALQAKISAERLELKEDEEQLAAREAESRWTTVENVLGLALGRTPRRALSTSASKQRLTQKAKADLSASQQSITELEAQINALTAEAQAAFKAIVDKWNAAAQDIQEARLTPKRTDILVEIFGLGWLPHWQIDADGQPVEIPAFPA